jgi:regulation of enolase protein 1 (concanavalin A-like superfamily)
VVALGNKDCAIIIGINNYTNYYGNLPPLEFAVNDALHIRDFLEKEIGLEYTFYFADDCPEKPQREEVSIGGNQFTRTLWKPTYVNIYSFLSRKNFENFFPNGSGKIWFFFSGHGQIINDREYLMASDSINNESTNALALDFIVGKLRDCGASDIVMFIDSCRTKKIGKGRVQSQSHRGTIIFRSCGWDKQSFEHPDIEHGVFTKVLLDGLNLREPNNCATVERLNNYLKEKVRELSEDLKCTDVQEPELCIQPLEKQKLILLKELASNQDRKKCPEPKNRSQLFLFASKKILLLIKTYNNQANKYQFSTSYFTIILLIIIFGLFFSYPVIRESTIKLMIGGENISWKDSKSNIPNKLNSIFQWSPGTNKKNSFDVLKNTLRITASPGTEYWRTPSKTDNLPPVISLPVNKDFEATVKVTLATEITFQRAYFGVRDSEKKYRQILIYLLENSRIEAGYVDETVPPGNNDDHTYMLVDSPIVLPSKSYTAYFRIKKYQNSFTLSYSVNGLQWEDIRVPSHSLPHEHEKSELFFSVISTSSYNSATGDFSDLSIRYLH